VLSANDVHHIVGLLYAATGSPAKVITLGEKVWDSGSRTKRDVDVVILIAGSTVMIAAEVKHTQRRLDVALVEGLCLKFIDMPSITDRNIVSSSGFTKPAVTKARKHAVRCLTLRRGPLRRLGNIDISRLTEIEYIAPIWQTTPNLRVFTEPVLPPSSEQRLRPALSIRYPEKTFPTISFAVLEDRLLSSAISHVDLNDDTSAVPVFVGLEIADAPYFTLQRTRYRIKRVEITGSLSRQRGRVPLSDTFTMENDAGQPFAGVAVAEVGDILIALATSSDGNALRFLLLPPGDRKVRPVSRI
jgi:hypothetical protein